MKRQVDDKNQADSAPVESLVRLRDGSIDAGLLLLERVMPRGVQLTQEEIAFVCGCSRGYIWLIEKKAMQKLRRVCAARRVRERVWPDGEGVKYA